MITTMSGLRHLVRWSSNLLYLASAACILAGLGQVLGPIYENPDVATEKFLCVGAINLYELALLGVLLLVLLWHRIVEDAVALTLLFACFLVGSAITIDVIAPGYGLAAAGLAVGGMVLAAAKLMLVCDRVTGWFSRTQWVAIAGLLALDFAGPAIMGMAQESHASNRQLQYIWFGGMCIAVAAMGVLIQAASHERAGSLCGWWQRADVVRSPLMRWAVLILVAIGTTGQAFALGWAFYLDMHLAHMLPLIVLLLVIWVALAPGLDLRPVTRWALALTPAVVLWAVPSAAGEKAQWLDTATQPAGAALLAALALALAGRRALGPAVWLVSAAYVAMSLVMSGIKAPVAALPETTLTLAVLWVGIVLVGVSGWLRHYAPALAGVTCMAVAAALASDPNVAWLPLPEPLLRTLLVGGIGLGVVSAVFPRVPLVIDLLGTATLALCVAVVAADVPVGMAATVTFAAVLWCAWLAAWTGRPWVAAPATIPVTWILASRWSLGAGWLLVAISFLLLLAGLAASWTKHHRRTAETVSISR